MPQTRGTSRQLSLILQLLLVILLTMTFYVVPLGIDPLIIWPILILFYLYALHTLLNPVSIVPGIKSFASIEAAFLLFYFIIYLLPYQSHLLGLSDITASILLPYTYSDYSNQAVVVAAIGFASFHLGLSLVDAFFASHPHPRRRIEKANDYRHLSWIVLTLLSSLIAFYTLAGLRSNDEGRYTYGASGSVTADGVYYLIVVLSIITTARFTAVVARRQLPETPLWIAGVIVLTWSTRLLLSGDRNNFFLIAIALGAGYSTFVRRTSIVTLAVAIAVSLSVYKAVEVVRMTDDRSFSALIDQIRGGDEKDNVGSLANSTSTLRATLDIVPHRMNYSYGWYKVVGFTGFVPYVRGIVLGDVPFSTTAHALSYFMLPPQAGWSVGTNVLSDIYFDFGLVGVSVLMIGLGMFAGYVQYRAARQPYSTKTITMYLVATAMLAELARYTLDFPVRALVWTWMLFWAYDTLARNLGRAANVADRKSKKEIRGDCSESCSPDTEAQSAS